MAFKICAILVTYNHYSKLEVIVNQLCTLGLKVFIVDDGSNIATKNVIKKIVAKNSMVTGSALLTNQGKGAAVEQALRLVKQAGFTHAFQIDADGQHSLANVVEFCNLAIAYPTAIISGFPRYDNSIPLVRKLGRFLTHVMVWLETLSVQIKDSMCGYRIYPVQQTLTIMDNSKIGKRMEFDTEIIVKLYWAGIQVVMSPVNVTYPKGNLSNFNPLLDNWRITKMHTCLFFGMLKRLPKLITRKNLSPLVKTKQQPIAVNLINFAKTKWSSLQERGTFMGLWSLVTTYRLLGKYFTLLLSIPVVFYFYLTSLEQRNASRMFLNRVFAIKKLKRRANFFDVFWHYMNFVIMMLDNFAILLGKIATIKVEYKLTDDFSNLLHSTKGAILFVSHHGNINCCRIIAMNNLNKKVYVLMHTKNSQNYHKILKTLNPQFHATVIEVTELTVEVSMNIKQYIDEGALVAIAVDRLPVLENNRICKVPFLGKVAAFPQGPYILAALLACPVYLGFAVRKGNKYLFSITKYAEQIKLTRKDRNQQIYDYLKRYVIFLEQYCLNYPYQWFNFFNFWHRDSNDE